MSQVNLKIEKPLHDKDTAIETITDVLSSFALMDQNAILEEVKRTLIDNRLKEIERHNTEVQNLRNSLENMIK